MKVVGAEVVAQQKITNFIAKGYDPRIFDNLKRRNYAKNAAHAFADGNRSRSGGYLLDIIEKDIEGALPTFERHLEELKGQFYVSKKSQDALREDLEAMAIWLACAEYLHKLRGRDEEDNEILKLRLRGSVRNAARALGLAEQSCTLVSWYGPLFGDLVGWLEMRQKRKPYTVSRIFKFLDVLNLRPFELRCGIWCR